MALVLYLFLSAVGSTVVFANFNTDFDITFGADHTKILDNGRQLQLSLDKTSGSGFQSKSEILFGQINMKIKLVPGYSAGTVTTFYLSSQGSNHDELDFEFLGRLPGDPYAMQTNVFVQGQGNREVRFNLWFDPTENFHTYSLLWNSHQILFSVDGTPMRVFKNMENIGVPYPRDQAMRVIGSLWDGSDWATDGGRAKVDYSKAPFVALFSSYSAEACINGEPCNTNAAWSRERISVEQWKQLKIVRKKYMTYDYCLDKERFPHGLPAECTRHS
ncbi:hypothetical protein SUGI_0441680 [Cryptomeria japonica]|uniref:xyloglucan endotransglucosylase protein 1 n=1 Tax=Cryptomeria japonica TaxID=3369 RepID=UPI0024089521|nr:xyloglucan endotransglucosylase protein 1 [Cryptomeria japonica]GLJ23341.1 hypothetical protein SUGI_0441680 [Cryptomeria japonica]